MFAGLGMLDEGLVRSYRRLTRSEFGIIVLIFVAINAFGLLEGVGVGMLATLVFFAVRLSRVNPIESRFTARERRSSRARSVPERAILADEGTGLYLLVSGRASAFDAAGARLYQYCTRGCRLADRGAGGATASFRQDGRPQGSPLREPCSTVEMGRAQKR